MKELVLQVECSNEGCSVRRRRWCINQHTKH